MHTRQGYTYLEVMAVATIMSIVALVAWPSSNDAANKHQEEVKRAAIQFTSDVNFARSLSIARPDDPAVIKIDVPGNRYWLARKSDVSTPIDHPVKKAWNPGKSEMEPKPYLIQYGAGGEMGMKNVTLHAADFGDESYITFDGKGNLVEGETAVLQLSSYGAQTEVKVNPISSTTTVQNKFTKTLEATSPEAEGSLDVLEPMMESPDLVLK